MTETPACKSARFLAYADSMQRKGRLDEAEYWRGVSRRILEIQPSGKGMRARPVRMDGRDQAGRFAR